MSTFPLQTRTEAPASATIIRSLLTQTLSVSMLPLILLLGLVIALTGCSSSVESLPEASASTTAITEVGLLESKERWVDGIVYNTYGAGGVLED